MFPPSGQEIIEKKKYEKHSTNFFHIFVFGMLLNAKFSVLASAVLQSFTDDLSD